MKRISLILLTCLAVLPVMAQKAYRVQHFEYEPRVGFCLSLNKMDDAHRSNGPVLGGELRYNFKDSPFDVGVNYDITCAYYTASHLPDDYEQSNRTFMLGLMGDYNFRQGGKVNPFVGFGVQCAVHDLVLDGINDTNEGRTTMGFVPRVGVELWRHLRFTLAVNISCKYYNNVSLTVGVAIGGGKKKEQPEK